MRFHVTLVPRDSEDAPATTLEVIAWGCDPTGRRHFDPKGSDERDYIKMLIEDAAATPCTPGFDLIWSCLNSKYFNVKLGVEVSNVKRWPISLVGLRQRKDSCACFGREGWIADNFRSFCDGSGECVPGDHILVEGVWYDVGIFRVKTDVDQTRISMLEWRRAIEKAVSKGDVEFDTGFGLFSNLEIDAVRCASSEDTFQGIWKGSHLYDGTVEYRDDSAGGAKLLEWPPKYSEDLIMESGSENCPYKKPSYGEKELRDPMLGYSPEGVAWSITGCYDVNRSRRIRKKLRTS